MSPPPESASPIRTGDRPEAITPGRYAGHVAVVTGPVRHRPGHGPAPRRRRRRGGLPRPGRGRHRGGGSGDQPEAADAGGRAIAARCDVTDEDAVAAAVSQAREELGHITNLCNIAGIGGFSHTPEQSLAGWDKIIAVNLTGTFLMCRAVLPGMIEHGVPSSTRCRRRA